MDMEDKAAATLEAVNNEVAVKLHDMDAQGALALRAANEVSTTKIHEIDECYQRAYAI